MDMVTDTRRSFSESGLLVILGLLPDAQEELRFPSSDLNLGTVEVRE